MSNVPTSVVDLSELFDHAPVEERAALEQQYRQDLDQLMASHDLPPSDVTYAKDLFLRRIVRFDKQNRQFVNAHIPLDDRLVKRVLLSN